MLHYTSILLYVFDRLAYNVFHFITMRINCVNFKWFRTFCWLSLWESGKKLRQDLYNRNGNQFNQYYQDI
jgi:hypothetical protein